MIVRVGFVVAAVLLLLGYALKVTWESVIKSGIRQNGDVYEVDLFTMSRFDMDQSAGTIADVPQKFRELDGKRVALKGEIAPGGNEAGDRISEFQLCYSVQNCCMTGQPQAQHFVNCKTEPGKSVRNYANRPGGVRVVGTLHVNVIKTAGKVESVFQMDLERAEPVS